MCQYFSKTNGIIVTFFCRLHYASMRLNRLCGLYLTRQQISTGQMRENPVYCAVKRRMDMTVPTVCR